MSQPNGHRFFDIEGRYKINDGEQTTFSGMIRLDGTGLGGIIEDGIFPDEGTDNYLVLRGAFSKRGSVAQFAFVIPSSKGVMYAAIAEKKNGEDPQGTYEGDLFVMPQHPDASAQLPIVGTIEFCIAPEPPVVEEAECRSPFGKSIRDHGHK